MIKIIDKIKNMKLLIASIFSVFFCYLVFGAGVAGTLIIISGIVLFALALLDYIISPPCVDLTREYLISLVVIVVGIAFLL